MKPTRKIIIVFLTMIISVNLLLPVICMGDSSYSSDKEDALLAAKLLLNEIHKKLASRKIEEDFLYGKMKGNEKGKFSAPDDALRLLKKEVENEMKGWFKAEAERVITQLDKGRKESTESYFDEKTKKALMTFPSSTITKNINNNIGPVYKNARSKVLSEQWSAFIGDVYPTEKQYEEAIRTDKLKELKKIVMDVLIGKQKEPMFAENKEILKTDIVDPLFDDVEKQWNRQQSIINNATGGTYVEHGDIAKHIRNELEKYRKDLAAEKAGKKVASKVYKVFDCVNQQIPVKANSIVTDKFVKAITRMNFPVDKAEIRSYIMANTKKHSEKDKSLEECKIGFGGYIESKVIEEHASRVDKSKRDDFKKYLESLIMKHAKCKGEMIRLVERSVKRNLTDARLEISQQQFDQIFGPLKEKNWEPSVKEIDKRYHVTITTVEKPLSMPGISSEKFDKDMLFEETIQLVIDAEKELINNGLNAIRSQMHIVDNLHSVIKNELESAPELPSVNELLKTYTEKVEAEWKNADKSLYDRYTSLFDRTIKDINRRVKDILIPNEKQRRFIIAERACEEAERLEKERMEAARREADRQEQKRREEEQRKQYEEQQRREEQQSTQQQGKGEKESKILTPPSPPKLITPNSQDNGSVKQGSTGIGTGSEGNKGSGEQGTSKGLEGGGGTGDEQGMGGGKGGGTGSSTGKGGGKGPGQKWEHKEFTPDIVIDLTFSNEKYMAKVHLPKTKVQLQFIMYTSKELNRFNLEQTQKVFEDWIESHQSKDDGGPKFAFARVFNRSVHYGMMYDFRECLEKALKDVQNENIKVYWLDLLLEGSEFEEYKYKPTVPQRFRGKGFPMIT